MILGPGGSIGQAIFGQLVRRVTGENIPLMKVNMHGNSTTYYAHYGQHVVVYKLAIGETVSVESENILAFTNDCEYSVRFLGIGVLSQKGLATTTLVGRGNDAYVASGESYTFEWLGNDQVTVLIQPSERRGGISVSMD